ncbi:MAG: H-NS histone family protein [Afipia sp.]|nr:H-NS histone family protein [Afipia sp.]OJW64403.1 MAG: histidinol phosphate phosphatase [Afipia sp. 64-13]
MRKDKDTDLVSMPFDELWRLHEDVTKVLAERIVAEKRQLEKRLAQINRSALTNGGGASKRSSGVAGDDRPPRRHYPRVLPKYRNPSSPSQTWSGRGKTPHWLANALKKGRKIDDFRIVHADKTRE